MPLRFAPAPAPARQSVLSALDSGAGPGPARLRPELALPVHEITGVSRQGPPRTGLTGWRFLLAPVPAAPAPDGKSAAPGPSSPPPLSAAETMPTADGWAFAHFRGGPYVSATLRALDQAEGLPLPYQPRLLSVPELYMLTLWLHSVPDADPAAHFPDAADLVIPLAPAPPGIASHQPQRVDTLLPLLTHRLRSVPLIGA
ncbi:hypothetical protein E4198_00630 [Streptomyces sp. RKND-216]|uniref:hypothetical protein n=1 Tax=Streptomyces sp. RKND-216 TaxID=2562581 RepID=UPI00109E3433|nr:hypothetical protein [Streptomyces sp. RKND-216]THA23444.1 hypothetical protein E4198_00630 [Streptomyces sp. RKND-216]